MASQQPTVAATPNFFHFSRTIFGLAAIAGQTKYLGITVYYLLRKVSFVILSTTTSSI